MLRLRALELHDFGPYKGTQRLEFLDRPGVTVIFGENGHGKTLLLNAIRYAFFGYVLGRGSRRPSLERIANRDAVSENGFPEFRVVLEFLVGDDEYQLTRRFGPVENGRDLREEVLLRRNGSNLNVEETLRELNRILPEQIARFFLFDGELLAQYEELLHTDSDEGEQIKEAIERILGIPVLTNAQADVDALAGEATKHLARAARQNQQTEQLGIQLEHAQEKKERLAAEEKELGRKLAEWEAEREEVEAALRDFAREQRLVEKRDDRRRRRAEQSARLLEAEGELREATAYAWQAAVAPSLERVIPELDRAIDERQEQYGDLVAGRRFHRMIRQGAETGECPVCRQSLDEHSLSRLQEHATNADDDRDQHVEQALRLLRNRRDTLRTLAGDDMVKTLDGRLRRYEDLRVEVAELDQSLRELDEQLSGIDDVDIRDRVNHLSRLDKLIHSTRTRRAEVRDAIDQQDKAIRDLERELRRRTGRQDDLLERRAQWLRDLADLFAEAIDDYRDSRRRQVQEEATALFLRMSHQPEYQQLKINDQYGLRIIHEAGEEESWRSAGFEHVVALSLLGGLQRSAPIRGPIIMDSPFGRLDDDHVQRVVAALPRMSEQVLLLVYKGELDRELAADALGPALLAEKELVQQTSRHTVIVDRETS